MAQEMAGLGFRRIELSHGIRITLVPGLLKALEEGVIEVGSTHNFCPLPTGVNHAAPNLFEPSARDEREQWVRHTKRSLDFAAQVKARVLVCHLGSVRFFWFDPAKRVAGYARRHPGASLVADPKYQAVLAKASKRLRAHAPEFWDRTKASVAAVQDYAAQKGVWLGFENREKFNELPLDGDYAAWLAEFPAEAPVGYWHDTGHAQIKHAMGVLDHRSHLEAMAPRLIGFHLHDVDAEGHDHQAVGTGTVDFAMVSRFWRPEHLLVLELSPRVGRDAVLRSRERLEELL